jgi:hypothetical protein
MRFSNDGSSWSAWEAYSVSKAWTLAAGDGGKTVYVQYKDNAGNSSGSYTDSITLDTQGPTGGIIVDNGKGYVNSLSATLALSASDSGSGVAQMRFSNDGSSWSAWEVYTASKAWTLAAGDGGKTVYVQYKDTVGNINASVISGSIVVDTVAPSKPAITSSSHPENTPISNGRVVFAWTGATDGGGSGIAGYSYAATPT